MWQGNSKPCLASLIANKIRQEGKGDTFQGRAAEEKPSTPAPQQRSYFGKTVTTSYPSGGTTRSRACFSQ